MQKGKAFVRMDVTHIPVELRQLLTFFACRSSLNKVCSTVEVPDFTVYYSVVLYKDPDWTVGEYVSTEQSFCLGSNTTCLQHTRVTWMTCSLLCHTLDSCYLVPVLVWTFCLLSYVSSQVSRPDSGKSQMKLYELQSAASCWFQTYVSDTSCDILWLTQQVNGLSVCQRVEELSASIDGMCISVGLFSFKTSVQSGVKNVSHAEMRCSRRWLRFVMTYSIWTKVCLLLRVQVFAASQAQADNRLPPRCQGD